MRIGIYDPYLDDLGGGEKYMMTIASCLAKNNDVRVFWDNIDEVKELQKRFSLDLSKIRFVKNIFSSNFGFFKKLLETKKYDIIIILSDGSIPFSLSKKTFIHLQQPIFISNLNLKTRFKISRINKFFCNSYYSKSYIDKSLSIESSVLYPPVEIKMKNLKKENIILHVGRFRVKDVTVSGVPVGDYKKQKVMVEAFKNMFNQGLKDWKFVLAVSVQDKDREAFNSLKKLANGYPIEFMVNKTNDELWDIYSKAKIYWHASGFGEDLIKHPEYAEHFGISTVEAMGAGVVPVVINAGGQKEIIEDGKSGFLWNSIDDLIQKTNELIKDQDLWEKLSKEAIRRANYFAGNRFCKELHEIIK